MTALALAQDDECSAAQAAPMLPVEGYVVAATRALEAAKSHAEQALLLLQWSPRDTDTMADVLADLDRYAANARNAYVERAARWAAFMSSRNADVSAIHQLEPMELSEQHSVEIWSGN
jgi:hypothetical protein